MENSLKLEKILSKVTKPARYTGGEHNSVVKNLEDVRLRFAFCFPDTYEVGMSHLGMKLLYGLYNSVSDVWCERVFLPEDDMKNLMKENDIELFGLESRDPLAEFDFLGFTLQYEMSFTAILSMLELSGIPFRTEERDESYPLIIGGGPCVCNPEPVADFFDLFVIGEGEEVSLELFELYKKHKYSGEKPYNKQAFLIDAAAVEGVYVPSLYTVEYNKDGTIAAFEPKTDNKGKPLATEKVKKRIIMDLDKVYYPDRFVIPFIDIVHDRAMSEIFRGCIRGCRFCQAGFIYRPVREKSPETINEQSRALCETSGYEEFSLTSLSTSDYSQFEKMLPLLLDWAEDSKTNISLPSLRVDGFSQELIERLSIMRKSSITVAPEAGTQRLRDAINKNVTEDDIFDMAHKAFSAGWSTLKLYFMLGLPTESNDDVSGISELGMRLVDYYYNMKDKPFGKGKGVSISISVSCFVPKPFTPFQWEAQDTMEMLEEKQKVLRSSNRSRKVSLKWHDSTISFIEAVLARGDRRLAPVIENVYRKGGGRDADSMFFAIDRWLEALNEEGLDPAFYANRKREFDEIFPWDHLDYGLTKEFLMDENMKTYQSVVTPHCREKCSNCGAMVWKGGVCVEKRK